MVPTSGGRGEAVSSPQRLFYPRSSAVRFSQRAQTRRHLLRRCGLNPWNIATELGRNGLAIEILDLEENRLQSQFQLFFRPRLAFSAGKLCVVGYGAAVEIGSLVQQFALGITLCGHTTILQENRGKPSTNVAVTRENTWLRRMLVAQARANLR